MRKFVLETLKVIVLLFLIISGVIISEMRPSKARASMYENVHPLKLTKKERDEYFKHLREIREHEKENSIYKWEID